MDFNPRSREGSDVKSAQCVSAIAAFQSTLPRRERPIALSAASGVSDFNPRSREGSDLQPRCNAVFAGGISIHAPAKGATPVPPRASSAALFQSTLPRRERLSSTSFSVSMVLFQSTLPRRERPPSACPRSCRRNFNPRSREGSDVGNSISYIAENHFNPRSREGSDPSMRRNHSFSVLISIHAPAKGATLGISPLAKCVRYFNPRSREGSDTPIIPQLAAVLPISIHAPAKGATYRSAHWSEARSISIHAPAKGATSNTSSPLVHC